MVYFYLHFDMGITENILGILLFVVVNAVYDFKKISAGTPINHRKEGLVQFTICAAFGMVCTTGVWSRIFLACLNLSIHFLIFDYLLNYLRGKKWFYLGSNFFDTILKGFNLRYYRLALKVLFVLIFSTLLIIS